jgi:hypothetical protein
MNHTELKCIDELKRQLIERKDDALAKGFVALTKGDMQEYQRQWAEIEQVHTLLKAMATYVWSEFSRQPESRLQ